jgi:transcriptional regulator with XRE-family HTH domain
MIRGMSSIRSAIPGRPYAWVGVRIESVRLHAGWTVTEMATVMKTTAPRYTDIQYGRVLPDAEKLEPLLERFGLSLDYLYLGRKTLLTWGVVEALEEKQRELVGEDGKPLGTRPRGRPRPGRQRNQ